MRRWYRMIALLLTVAALCACASEMPEELLSPDEDDGEWSEENLYYKDDVINTKIYQPSTVNQYSNYMLNMPGMVLVVDQHRGASLFYINKQTGIGHIFCFDPLCNHNSCPAAQIMLPEKCIYHPDDNALYYSIGPASRMGTQLYRLDLETYESEIVWEGNGNRLYRRIYVYRDYLILGVKRAEDGYDFMRFDVKRGSTSPIQPPKGKLFQSITVCGDEIYVTFQDDDIHYRTNINFSSYTPTDLPFMGTYFDDTIGIRKIKGEETSQNLDYQNVIGFEYYNRKTGEQSVFYLQDQPLNPKGFDGEYVYFTVYQKKDTHYAEGRLLHRVSVKDGLVEELCEVEGTIFHVVKFEDTLYYSTQIYEGAANPQFIYGTIRQTEDGYTAEHFEIEY